MTNIINDQIIVIIFTTLSLLTAWSWNSFIEHYTENIFGDTLQTKFLISLALTIITIIIVKLLFKDMAQEKIERVKDISHKNNILDYSTQFI